MSTFKQLFALLPANDNGRFVGRIATATAEDIARLVALAGYDPERIDPADRLAALHVVWCLEKGIFTEREIGRFVGRDRAGLVRLIALLERAKARMSSGRI